MSTIVNAADVALQATGTRILPVGLPLNQAVNFSQVNGGTKPSNNADVTSTIVNGGLVLTSGGITMSAGGSVKGGQTSFNSGTGFFLGYEAGAYKLSLGNPAGHHLTWDGTNLAFSGDISAASGTFTGSINTGGFVFCNGSGFLGTSIYGQTSTGVGVQGSATSLSGVGVRAAGAVGGIGLDVLQGGMSIANSTLVANLNAQYWNGTTIANAAAGTATATLLANKPGANSNSQWLVFTNGATVLYIPAFA